MTAAVMDILLTRGAAQALNPPAVCGAATVGPVQASAF